MKRIILVMGEYACKDFTDAHKNEKHTVEEWKEMIAENDELSCTVRAFSTGEALVAYKTAVEDCENYLSSDFYTFAFIGPDQIV